MRKNQVNIIIDRFDDEAPNGLHEQISIYADSNNIFEALSGAYSMALNHVGNPAVGKSIQTKGTNNCKEVDLLKEVLDNH